jgi:CBS domain containing-hemolysin-like protein
MVPRTEMVAVPSDITLSRIGEVMRTSEHSRYPVFEGSSDNVVGILSAKRLAAVLASEDPDTSGSFDVRRHMSPPLFATQALRADQLLAQMKQSRSHLAILVDEYGTTAGLVTLRDMLDRIAGEAPDESELESPTVQRLADGTAVVDGLALLPDVEAEFGIAFGSDDYDTLGGFIFGRLGRRPAVGDRVEAAGTVFTVQELDGLRVSRVRVTSATDASEASENGPRAVHS